MDPSGNGNKGKRRSWTAVEEEVLIQCLKDLNRNGWKADNGWRPGHLRELEKEMKKELKGTDICANPHINSKLHTWKLNYNSLAAMLGNSGIGWDDTRKMIDVIDSKKWEDVVQADPNARLMRFKTWPLYEHWVEIFGKDRATGEHAQGAQDEMPNQNDVADHVVINLAAEIESDDEHDAQRKKQKTKGNKKKSANGGSSSSIVDALNVFMHSSESRIGQVAQHFGREQEAAVRRSGLFALLEKIEGISLMDKLTFSDELIRIPERLDFFYGLPETARKDYVQFVLAKAE